MLPPNIKQIASPYLGDFRLDGLEVCRHVEAPGEADVTEVLLEGDAEHGEPLDVEHCQIVWQAQFYVLALVAVELLQTEKKTF